MQAGILIWSYFDLPFFVSNLSAEKQDDVEVW